MPHSLARIFLLLLLFSCCKNGHSPDNPLYVRVEQTSLRAEPDKKSKELAVLKKGEVVFDLNVVGSRESLVALGEEVQQSPWLQVKTAGNQIGWVLMMALKQADEKPDWLLQKRLECYFGKGLAARRNTLLAEAQDVHSDAEMAKVWREAVLLRDTFLYTLERQPENDFPLQFQWLGEAIPGFLYQKFDADEQIHLFADFSQWLQIALKTSGLQDDAFFQVCIGAFPQDSIESFFPAWKFQISETESASQLGTGQHEKMLQRIDATMPSCPLFSSQLLAFKEQVLDDIFGKEIHYWQSQEKILAELSRIIANPPSCLHAQELEAFDIRAKMFEAPELNGIKVNLRSGE